MNEMMYRQQYLSLRLERDQHAGFADGLGLVLDGAHDFSFGMWFLPQDGYATLFQQPGCCSLSIVDRTLTFSMEGFIDIVTKESLCPVLYNQWNYAAVTYSRKGQFRVYINGYENVVMSVSGKATPPSSPLYFGGEFNGFIRELCTYDRVLGYDECCQESFEVQGLPSMVRRFDFSRPIPVEGRTGKVIDLYNGAKVLATAEALTFSNHAGVYPLDGNLVNPGGYQGKSFSVQCWILVRDAEQSFSMVFMNGEHYLDCGMALFLEKVSGKYYPCASRGMHTDERNILRSPSPIGTNVWVNVAVTYDSSDLILYVDGIQFAKTVVDVPFSQGLAEGRLRIGSDDLVGEGGDEGSFHGQIGRIDVWDIALCADEVMKYCMEAPEASMTGLCAKYYLTSTCVYNEVDGYSLGLIGMDQNMPSLSDPSEGSNEGSISSRPSMPPCLDAVEAHRLIARDLATFPSTAEFLSDAADIDRLGRMSELSDQEGGFRGMLSEYETALRSGTSSRCRYLHDRASDGRIHMYMAVEGMVYDVLGLESGDDDEYFAWTVRLLSTLLIDGVSLFVALPKNAAAKIPEAFKKYLTLPMIWDLLKRELTVTTFVAAAVKFFKNGVFRSVLTTVLVQSGMTGVEFLVEAIVKKFFTNFSNAASWVFTGVKATAMLYDIYSIIKAYPALEGFRLQELKFYGSDPAAIQIAPGPGTPGIKYAEYNAGDKTTWPVAYGYNGLSGSIRLKAGLRVFDAGRYYIRANVVAGTDLTDVLGPVLPQLVDVKKTQGEPFQVEIELTQHKVCQKGISRSQIEWEWQYSKDGSKYEFAGRTRLEVFVLYDKPTAPWLAQPPWVSLLTCICKWLDGLKNPGVQGRTDIIRRMMDRFWNIPLVYAEDSPTRSAYSGLRDRTHEAYCDVSAFVRDFDAGYLKIVNSSDCAALLCSLCDMVGCDIQTRMITGELRLKKRIPIGFDAAKAPMSVYSQYEVATSIDGEDLLIYDCSGKWDYGTPASTSYEYAFGVVFHSDSERDFSKVFVEDRTKASISVDQKAVGDGRRRVR